MSLLNFSFSPVLGDNLFIKLYTVVILWRLFKNNYEHYYVLSSPCKKKASHFNF